MDLQQQLTELIAEQKIFVGKANEDIKTIGSVTKETTTKLEALQKQMDALDASLQKRPAAIETKSFTDELKENEGFQRLVRDGRGTAVIHLKNGVRSLERKTTITSTAVGSATSGVLLFERDPGVELQPMKRLFIRDLLPSSTTTFNAIDYVKVNVFTNNASPQVEASDKNESALTFTTATANVRTLAHWIPATRQILDDFTGLEETIRTELMYGLKDKEEQEILSGDNTGQHLNGLITQATAFNTALLPAAMGWNKADILARAVQQLEVANQIQCEWFALNPADFWDIALTKDKNNNYLIGNAYNTMNPTLWGRRVLETNNIAAGTFLAGNSIKASIRDREGANIEISTEHASFFTQNLVAIRCEERLALVNRRPASFITGSLNTSP